MNVHSMFPSKFVAASDLMGQDVVVVIARVHQEPVGADEEVRPTLYFQGMQKGMVMNRTNAKRIAALYGQDTDHWIGRPITLYPSETEYAGDTVPCIRVRTTPPMLSEVPAQAAATPAAAPVVPARIPAMAGGNGAVRF